MSNHHDTTEGRGSNMSKLGDAIRNQQTYGLIWRDGEVYPQRGEDDPLMRHERDPLVREQYLNPQPVNLYGARTFIDRFVPSPETSYLPTWSRLRGHDWCLLIIDRYNEDHYVFSRRGRKADVVRFKRRVDAKIRKLGKMTFEEFSAAYPLH